MEIALLVLIALTLAVVAATLLTVALKGRGKKGMQLLDDTSAKMLDLDRNIAVLKGDMLENSNHLYQMFDGRFQSYGNSLEEMKIGIGKDINATVSASMNSIITSSLKSMTDQVDGRLRGLEDKLSQNISSGYAQTNKTFNDISSKMEALKSTVSSVEKLDVSVSSLKNILTNNQQRGQFGERVLESILFDVFGETHGIYELQKEYQLSEDKKVRPDAAIHLPEYDILIDSKYPFKEYSQLFQGASSIDLTSARSEDDNRYSAFVSDVKKHINKIAGDYIIKGVTADQAIMFIPNDGVYTFINANFYEKIVVYASKKKVVLTSPSTLQPILYTLYSLRLNYDQIKNGRQIIKALSSLSKSFESMKEDWDKMSKAIDGLSQKKVAVDTRIQKFGNTFSKYAKSELTEASSQEEGDEEAVGN